MKQFAAILLLTLFLFNFVGYRLWFTYAQQKADTELEASIDKNQYNDKDLITIKVPLSMPYQTVQSGFERVTGEINIGGKIYKYVKRRIVDGEMVLMCLPDQNKMRIESAKTDYFKNTADLAQNNNSTKSNNAKTNVFKNIAPDYEQHSATAFNPIISAVKTNFLHRYICPLSSLPHTAPGQPPDNLL